MSAPSESPTAAPSAETAPPSGNGKLKLAAAGGAAVAGIALGLLVLGPRISGAPKAGKAEKAAHAPEKEGATNESKLVRVDNVVVNPAGSEGMRFVMASVAFEVNDPAAENRLRNAEIQVRDAISGVFERQTMAELTREGARDSLRLELAAAVAPLLNGAGVKVFLPQFVIQ